MADKELSKVRTQFADKVSTPVISQLLDHLLEDGILNDGEIESILEVNQSRANRARDLIDTVRKKGDAASRKLIAHLRDRDTQLYTSLGLSAGQPAAAGSQEQEGWSAVLTPTTEAFWREKLNDKSTYPVTQSSYRSRVALLITNIKFTNERLNRDGAEKDEQNMESLLRALGYEVVKHTNLTGKAIDAAVMEFSKHPKLKETDSVFVVIMSHGKLGAVLGVNWKEKTLPFEKPDEFQIDNLYKHLGTANCPALLNKPKTIIIQACRGVDPGSVLVSDSASGAASAGPPELADDGNIVDDALKYAHKEKDFISLLSSTPDTVGYRHRDRGSFMILYCVEVLKTFAHKDDIEELFRKVMQRFEEFAIQQRMQMPTKDRCSLTKRFYLFPGLAV